MKAGATRGDAGKVIASWYCGACGKRGIWALVPRPGEAPEDTARRSALEGRASCVGGCQLASTVTAGK